MDKDLPKLEKPELRHLDDILRYLATLYEDTAPIPADLIKQRSGIGISGPLAYLMLVYMSEAGYVWNQNGYFQILMKGLFFIQQGGYEQEKKKEDLKIQAIKDEMALRKRNDRRLISGTYLVAVGAIGLVIWEVGVHFHWW